MKVTATIVASSAALVRLTHGVCGDGYGQLQQDSSIVPMNVCIAKPASDAAHGVSGQRAVRYTCANDGGINANLVAYAETFSDYLCANSLDSGVPQATDVFTDSNGDIQVTCEYVANCGYYHIHKFGHDSGQACGTIAQKLATEDTAVSSQFFISQVDDPVNQNINFCESDGGSAFTRSSINAGFCEGDNGAIPTTGAFITKQAYDDNQCTTATAGSTPSTLSLTAATDNALDDDPNTFMDQCRYFVACSDENIITSAPTTAPTESPTASPTDAPTEAPSAEPTEAPSDAPTAAPVPTEAPSDAPSAAPSASPTAAPVSAETDAPTASPVATDAPSAAPTTATTTAAPTTAQFNSASQFSSIVALLMASYYAIIA